MDITDSDIYRQLVNAALRFVSMRPRSEKEIRDYIGKRLGKMHASSPESLEAVCLRMTELGYADDVAFAKWWVESRTGRKPKGARVIREELMRKGVSPEVIGGALATMMHGDRDEVSLARVAVSRKIAVWRTLPPDVRTRKMSEYLLRRGFSYDAIRRVVDEPTPNG